MKAFVLWDKKKVIYNIINGRLQERMLENHPTRANYNPRKGYPQVINIDRGGTEKSPSKRIESGAYLHESFGGLLPSFLCISCCSGSFHCRDGELDVY